MTSNASVRISQLIYVERALIREKHRSQTPKKDEGTSICGASRSLGTLLGEEKIFLRDLIRKIFTDIRF